MRMKLGKYVREIGTLNSKIPGRTVKEYMEENIDIIKDREKEYREANIEKNTGMKLKIRY